MKASFRETSPVNLTVRKGRLFPVMFTLVTFFLFIVILYGQDYFWCSSRNNFDDHLALHQQPFNNLIPPININPKPFVKSGKTLPFALGKGEEECDIFKGKWVWDNITKPMYEESECPYIHPGFNCQTHGRPDSDYQFWRWQPRACDLPKFNTTVMLEALRNKRMLFVGDSISRGQYLSMICLLNRLAPQETKAMEIANNIFTVFQLKEYNATVEFYWAPFLLESNVDDGIIHRVPERIIRKGSINTHGKHWKGADIVIFNTYLWWLGPSMKILKGSFTDKEQEIEELPTEEAYRMGMKSLLKWVETNMDPNKTRVFFSSMPPTHSKSIDWDGEPGGNCYNETTMIEDPNYWGPDSYKSVMKVIREEFSKSKVPMSFLNITQLSSYRKDAHSQIYKKQWTLLTPEQQADPKSYADCIHWCLPGLQDTWNKLLFTKLFYP